MLRDNVERLLGSVPGRAGVGKMSAYASGDKIIIKTYIKNNYNIRVPVCVEIFRKNDAMNINMDLSGNRFISVEFPQGRDLAIIINQFMKFVNDKIDDGVINTIYIFNPTDFKQKFNTLFSDIGKII